jgi:hypothetical protein
VLLSPEQSSAPSEGSYNRSSEVLIHARIFVVSIHVMCEAETKICGKQVIEP